MTKIDFSKLPCWVDIRKAAKMELDVRYEFSNAMYLRGNGIEMAALAMKIYNSKGEEEYTPQECAIIKEFAKVLSPMFSDSINEILEKNEDSKV